MPSSPNRRRIEIPVALYERLEAQATRSQLTTAALGATLLTAALDQPQPYQEIGEQLRQLIEAGTRQQGELRAIHELVQARPPLATQRQEAAPQDAPAQRRARPFNDQDYRSYPKYRVSQADSLPGSQGLAALPPVVAEYLRLVMLSDLAHSDQMREHYREQVATLRRQLEAIQPATSGERPDE